MNNNTRTFNTKKNLINGLINMVLVILLSFATRTIFVKILSTEYLGINGLYSNILNLLALSELGLSNIALFSLYKPLAEKNEEKISQLVSFFDKVYHCIFVIIILFGIMLIPLLKYILNTELEMKELIIYYLLYLISTSISYIGISRQILINADQRIYVTKNATTLFNIIQNILQIITLFVFKNYYMYLIIQLICNLSLNLFLIFKANRLYPFLNSKAILPKKEKISILKRTKDLFVYKISVVIINCTDNIFISALLGTSIVGYYSNYAMVIGVFTTIMTTIINSINSSIGNLNVTSSNEKKINIFYNLLFIMQWIVGFFSAGMIIMFNDFISLWIGEDYKLSFAAIIVIVLNFYLQNIINPIWMYRESLGLFKEVKPFMFMAALLNILLTYILGKTIGLPGIFLATIFSRLFTVVWYEPILLFKKNLRTRVGKYYLSQILYITIFAITTILIYFVTRNLTINSLISFALKGLIITLLFNLIYLLIFFKNHNFKFIVKKILNK